MLKRWIRIFMQIALLILILAALVLLLPRAITGLHSAGRVYDPDSVPAGRVAIVFGAGLTRDGRPTAVLRDRVETAAYLYKTGKVEKLLVSGDNRFENYNEPAAMQAYAASLGVPESAITADYAGRRTYDTCYRAKHIFGVHEAILVTQSFHLPRALYLCSRLGVEATGVDADVRAYRLRSKVFWNLREIPATLVALWEANVSHPLPVLGSPEPIFPNEAQ